MGESKVDDWWCRRVVRACTPYTGTDIVLIDARSQSVGTMPGMQVYILQGVHREAVRWGQASFVVHSAQHNNNGNVVLVFSYSACFRFGLACCFGVRFGGRFAKQPFGFACRRPCQSADSLAGRYAPSCSKKRAGVRGYALGATRNPIHVELGCCFCSGHVRVVGPRQGGALMVDVGKATLIILMQPQPWHCLFAPCPEITQRQL